MNDLERFYEKFDEEKRLQRSHGKVEFFVTTEYIKKYLKKYNNPKVADIGAGTGAYSVFLEELGVDVSAVEYTKKNLKVLRAKQKNIKSFLGDAKNLSMFKDKTFDITLVFGPMYHAKNIDEKLQILSEAKRITKSGGTIFVAYYGMYYALIVYGFKDNNILQSLRDGRVDKNFDIRCQNNDLFSFDNLKSINGYNKLSKLKRIEIFSPDGPSDYMREVLNDMDSETFEIYKNFVLKISKNKNLIDASSHYVDIVKKL